MISCSSQQQTHTDSLFTSEAPSSICRQLGANAYCNPEETCPRLAKSYSEARLLLPLRSDSACMLKWHLSCTHHFRTCQVFRVR